MLGVVRVCVESHEAVTGRTARVVPLMRRWRRESGRGDEKRRREAGQNMEMETSLCVLPLDVTDHQHGV